MFLNLLIMYIAIYADSTRTIITIKTKTLIIKKIKMFVFKGTDRASRPHFSVR